MTKQQIVKYGDPGLRKVTSRVLKFDKSLRKLIEDMFETMYASDGVGLAAPQIGVSKRVLVLDVDYPSKRYIDEQTKSLTDEIKTGQCRTEKKEENIGFQLDRMCDEEIQWLIIGLIATQNTGGYVWFG